MFDYEAHAALMREIFAFQRRPENWDKPLFGKGCIRGAEAKALRARYNAMSAVMECYRGQLDVARIVAACEGPPTLDLSCTATTAFVGPAGRNLAPVG